MVLLHIKRSDERNTFLYETKCSIKVKDLVEELVHLHDLRLKALRLAEACRGLAEHGPMRPEEARGLTEETAKLSGIDVNAQGTPTNPDPHGYRCGVPPSNETAEVLKKTATEAEEALSHQMVSLRTALTLKKAEDALASLKGAVMIAYPGNHKLPDYDPCRQILEDKEDLEGRQDGREVLHSADSCCLWWAGKELRKDKELGDLIGRNEKTKIVARLTQKGSGAPVREPRIDEATHKAMLAFYHKKEREQK
eukprot:Cvel_34278.t1-p1 / transcript=Cvel_34278.t1 / gene=Cvel_34278 / organism=Chromera_velia_CCMP2878 / gene_product=Uncharacterized protein C21orf59, putative / transcript_product=Uncharacterized protein C21orf59, putative / location=Cvel_scaffold5821:1822-4058(+) / protein_length=251 / sequence_SO=supercontig / SO=protein_coding / is_pseudo=false